ncbi:proprotein convertase P-domain-containing protein [bacterium]|nr:proprotein convertase P-domain-containing protein [bacterium]MCI0602754.1 proprotein convertase P-domain-containing protein [bacterium]
MKKITTILASVALFVLANAGSTFASNITKTFEFGPGTQYSSSVFRTFPVPCGRQVAAVVKFKRLGPSGTSNNIPIIIELREPDTAANQEGPLVEARNANATTSEQIVTILSFGGGSPRGCTLPWRVRVKYGAGTPSFAISGTIRIDYDGTVKRISIPFTGVLFKGESKSISFGDTAGFAQGIIEITADWHHQLTTVLPGPNPIKLRIELVNPGGTTVRSVEAFSSNEARSELTKFKLTHKVASCAPGQWKLKITNTDTSDTAFLDNASPVFVPSCS